MKYKIIILTSMRFWSFEKGFEIDNVTVQSFIIK